jgi:GNAT superfamily N-acetyltransferase
MLVASIRYVEKIEGSPVVRYVATAWVALMDEGQWSKSSVLVSGDLQCVYAVLNRKIVGCLTFHVDEDTNVATVNIAYVGSKYRGQGIYRQLHEEFTKRAIEQGAKTLLNICYPTNVGIRETVQKLGYALAEEHWVKTL